MTDTDQIPLLVDLDGSLIRTDTLFEMTVLYIKKFPWLLFNLFFWLLNGKNYLKQKLSENTELDVHSLPYRSEVLEYLEREAACGREIILFTGSWQDIASRIAAKFSFFRASIATNSERNLTGVEKHQFAVDRWGKKAYDYLGNESRDLEVWKDARNSIVVGSNQLAREASKISKLERHFPVSKSDFKTVLRAIRVHQWAKNVLLFVPLVTAQMIFDEHALFNSIVGYVVFCGCASATYLLNDMLDLSSDRAHPTKRNRPIASGDISIPQAASLGFGLFAISAVLALLFLNTYFVLALFSYILLTVVYSFKLKRLQTIDVISLASLFTIRVIAGAAAIEVILSFWLLSFSMFIFLSLALVKRVAELIRLEKNEGKTEEVVRGRGYFVDDISILQSMGVTSGFLSVLVFSFYINSQAVTVYYQHPEILWLICPILGYWIMRIWMMTARDEMEEDPISFAIKDRNSWLAATAMVVVLIAAYLT